MLEEGHLKEYIQRREPRKDGERDKVREKTLPRIINTPPEGTRVIINMIISRESMDGESLRKRKAQAH